MGCLECIVLWVVSPTQGTSFLLGKVTTLGVLCCFALFVCLTLLASFFLSFFLSFFFLPSLSSLIKTWIKRMHKIIMHSTQHALITARYTNFNGLKITKEMVYSVKSTRVVTGTVATLSTHCK